MKTIIIAEHFSIRNQIQHTQINVQIDLFLSKLARYFTSFVTTNINLGFIFYFLLGISLIFLFKQGFFWGAYINFFYI